jgi:excinuclease UvrABC nuclease subunit
MRYRIATADLPDEHGVYVVYKSVEAPRPLYVGKAQSQTIRQRWMRNHLKDRAGGSALRRSLGPYLGLVDRKLVVSQDGRHYQEHVEDAITRALRTYYIEFHTTSAGEESGTLERRLIQELDPILNVQRPKDP